MLLGKQERITYSLENDNNKSFRTIGIHDIQASQILYFVPSFESQSQNTAIQQWIRDMKMNVFALLYSTIE